MTFYVPEQNTVIAVLSCLGFFIAFLYDIFCIPGRIVKLPKTLLFMSDLVFCLVSCLLFIVVIYITNYGYVRWYEFAFTILGFCVYRIVFERYILALAVNLTRLVLKILKYVLSLLLSPIVLMFKCILKAVKKAYEKTSEYRRKSKLKTFSKNTLRGILAASEKGFND